MADKTLSSIVGHQVTRQLELPNIFGTIFAAGTRGVIGQSPLTGVWGFMPLANLGRLNTYELAALGIWIPGNALWDAASPKIPCAASVLANNGDLLVATWLNRNDHGQINPVNVNISMHAFDGVTGDYLTSSSITALLDYTSSSEVAEATMGMWEVKTDFYLIFIKDRPSTERSRFYGINYDTTTQTFGTPTALSVLSTSGQAALSNYPVFALNNAGDEVIVSYVQTAAEACRWVRLTIGGSAGAWTFTGQAVADQFSFDGAGAFRWKMGGNSHCHRLSNDDIIIFGAAVSGTATSISYTVDANKFINIFDNLGAAFTQSYHLLDEIPSTAETSKNNGHICLHSWEIATDTYLLLTKCGLRSQAQAGPDGFWSDRNGFDHVRAVKVVINPADNSQTQTDLGQFDAGLFVGLLFASGQADELRDKSSVYDFHLDIANEFIIITSKTYVIKLQFTASFAATDNANSRTVFGPTGPKLLNADQPLITTAGAFNVNARSDAQEYSNRIFSEHLYVYDHSNQRLWCPTTLTYSASGDTDSTAACVTYDIVQICGTAVEVVVAEADANNVQCIADYDCFDNNGIPVGSSLNNTFAITASQVIATIPEGTLLDVLVGSLLADQSGDGELRMVPEDEFLFDESATPMVVQKGRLTSAVSDFGGNWNAQENMVFNLASLDQVNPLQDAGYNGPAWAWDDLDGDLWFWFQHGNAATDYANLIFVSEGWWCAGGHGAQRSGTTSSAHVFAYQFKATSRIEMNGRFATSSDAFFLKHETRSKR